MKILDETGRKVVKRGSIRAFFFLSFLLGILLTSGSQGKSETKPTLVILPFLMERAEDPGKGVICSIWKGIRRSGEVLQGSHNTLTHLLHEKMEAKGAFRILPLQEGEVLLSQVERKTLQQKPVPTFLGVGKRLTADFLWIGTLFRFEKRIGSSLGVERPASVSFDLHLFRLRDERVVWIGKFDET